MKVISHTLRHFSFRKLNSITNILENLQWPTLQERRKSARLVLLYKVLHDLLIIPNCYLPFKSTVLRTRHSHNFKQYLTN